jgi:folate-dependent phosphoribosylglycinamide formyltransferase PurN
MSDRSAEGEAGWKKGRLRVAVISNGNFFSTLMLRPAFEAPEVEMVGAVLVRQPPGSGGPISRLARLSRRTGFAYTRHKLGTLVLPKAYGVTTGTPVFLTGLCSRHRVPFRVVTNANRPEAESILSEARPDVLLSVSCPQKVSEDILRIPRLTALNVHWALLPRYAGIAPYFWVLRRGEHRTGVTVHVMTPELDEGPVLRQREMEVRPDDTSLSLQLRLTRVAGEEMVAALRELPGSLERARPQDLSGRSSFTWPSSEDVRAFKARGRRFARLRDYREGFRQARGD